MVLEDGEVNKNEYRKFKIQTIFQPNPARHASRAINQTISDSAHIQRNFSYSHPLSMAGGDVGMLTEVLMRRFKRTTLPGGWTLPDLILIDGGLPQVNAARRALFRAGLKIPIVGIAKGAERKRNDIIGTVPGGVPEAVLIHVRDEAHRFAITYHKKLRRRKFLE